NLRMRRRPALMTVKAALVAAWSAGPRPLRGSGWAPRKPGLPDGRRPRLGRQLRTSGGGDLDRRPGQARRGAGLRRRSRCAVCKMAVQIATLDPNVGHVMNTPFPVRQDGKFSVEEFFALLESRPEEERRQLLDGVAMMVPPPTRVHQQNSANLAFELNAHFRANGLEFSALQEVGLIVPEAELFRPQADVAVFDAMADYSSYADTFYLVAEVLSDSNTDKDIAVKRQRYLQH